MYDIDIKGMNFIRILRCSEDEQEEDSFKQQLMTTDKAAERNEINICETVKFPGFSATTGKQVQPYLDLIRIYAGGKCVQGFVLDSYSRWARNEVDEATLFAACRDANLLILTDKEGLMMGAGTWAKRGAATDQSEGYARDIGRNVNRAVIKLIMDGLIPPTLSFPWGLDREYYDASGRAVFRVRRLPDGRRAVLDPEEPHAVRFHISKKKQRLNLREDDFSFKWVPGAPELQPVAREILRRHYLEGEPASSICADLNRRHIYSSNDRPWQIVSVAWLLRNPIWIGLSVGFTMATGRHVERKKGGPHMYPFSRRPGYRLNQKRRKTMAPRKKPAVDWIIQTQPKLVNFLDDDVRAAFQKRWQQRIDSDGGTPRPPRQRRKLPPKSRYFLSGLLWIKDTDRHMVGSDGPRRGKGDDVSRYYISSREAGRPVAGAPKERVNAEIVEDEVRKALRVAVEDFPINTSKLKAYIDQKRSELRGRVDNTGTLQAEKNELEAWYKNTFSLVSSRGKQLLASEAQRVEKRLEEIEVQMAEAGMLSPEYLTVDTVEIVKSVQQQFRELPPLLDRGSHEALRNLSAALCSKMTFDPVNRLIEIEVSLPSWALSKRHLITKDVGTEESHASRIYGRTNSDGIVLSSISCSEAHIGKKQCFTCTRSDYRKVA